MSYPNAYCLKCGAHTETQQKHTVILQNNAQSRALRGFCASCQSQVYKILPKGVTFNSDGEPSSDQQKYPDAYCVRCQEFVPTRNAHTVYFKNDSHSRAVTGSCAKCGSEAYRILGQKGSAKPAHPQPQSPDTGISKTLEAVPAAVQSERLPAVKTGSMSQTSRVRHIPVIRRAEGADWMTSTGINSYLIALTIFILAAAGYIAMSL